MKKILVIYIVLISLTCSGQHTNTLNIGDNAPTLSAFRWIKGTPITKWERGRIYVIEFGATWCTPCAAAIPELSRMAQTYKNNVTIISMFVMEVNNHANDLNPAYQSKVESYVKKRWDKMNYTIAVDDPLKTMENAWLKAAKREGIPHLFIIDKEGKISAIESHPAEAEKAIQKILSGNNNGNSANTQHGQASNPEVRYNPRETLLVGGNGGDEEDFLFRSILTRYNGKFRSPNPSYIQSYRWGPLDSIFNYQKDRIQLIGASLAELYQLAYADTLSNWVYSRNYKNEYADTISERRLTKVYGKQWHLPLQEVKDQSPFIVNPKSTDNRYNYSLKVPAGTGTASFLQKCMQKDLSVYFGYQVTVESRLLPYWELALADLDKVKTKLFAKDQSKNFEVIDTDNPNVYRGAEMRDMIWILGSNYGYFPYDYGKVPKDNQGAFIDHTGVKQKIDFLFNPDWSFDQMKTYLKTLGLELRKAEKYMKVVVIRE